MTDKFNSALEIVLKHEGGYVKDPDDLGGETYRGISRKFHPDWYGWRLIDKIKSKKIHAFIDGDSIELNDLVKSFYYDNFWLPIKGDEIRDSQIANLIFDFAVNAGVKRSVQIAQSVLEVEQDGIIGKQTLKALNEIDEEYFVVAFTVRRINFYVDSVKKRPANQKFFYGWVRRALNDF